MTGEVQAPSHLLIDWKIEVLTTMDAALISLLLLPTEPGSNQPVGMRPLGLPIEQLRRLHRDLGELIRLVDSGGSPQPGAKVPQ